MPAHRKISPALKQAMQAARDAGISVTKIGKTYGVSKGTVSEHTTAPEDATVASDVMDRAIPARQLIEHPDGSATISCHTDRPVKTLEDAVRVAEVDTTVWYVERYEISQWTVPMKISTPFETGAKTKLLKTPIQTQQYRVRVHLRRIMQRSLQQAADAVFERLAQHAYKYPPAAKVRPAAGEPCLAVLGLFDIHFGKLAWGKEAGEDYDLKIAEAVYRNAVDDMLVEATSRPVQRYLLPIGNDFYHLDNSRNTTHAGTPQDVDGRYAKIIEAGEMAVVAAIERLMGIAPVDVVWIPGNHDPTTSYHLARTVSAWFRKAARVTVDAGPSPRKYVRYGATLIGLTHGNEEKVEDLPGLMATERPTDWAAAVCREWLVGHQHRSRRFQTKPVDTHQGTTVRVLQSLAGTDAWHHRKGYVNSRHAAEVLFYGRDRGYSGHSVVFARSVS